MTTMTLNTPGLAAKYKGMAQAENASQEWSDRATELIEQFANEGREFTSEDVTNIIGLPSGATGLNENNAVGSAFSKAARRGIIEWTGRLVQSSREERHASDLRVWRKTQPDNPYLRVEANTLRRLAAMANKGLSALTDPDQEFVTETQQMIAQARATLVSSH